MNELIKSLLNLPNAAELKIRSQSHDGLIVSLTHYDHDGGKKRVEHSIGLSELGLVNVEVLTYIVQNLKSELYGK